MSNEQLVIGREAETGELVSISCARSKRVLVCGKTGTGKSYTLGVIIEELARASQDIVLVIDAQGIFWTMAERNTVEHEVDGLWQYGLQASGLPVNLLIPGDPEERFEGQEIPDELERRGISVQGLRLNPSDLPPDMWCDLFRLDINGLMGILLFKAVRLVGKRLGRDFLIDDIAAEVVRLPALDVTKEAVLRKLEMATDWQLFAEDRYREVWEILRPDAINVLDLSVISQGRYGIRNLVIAVLAGFIFRQRTLARRREALGLPADARKVWLLIDEAHNFCPSGRSTLSKDVLVRWAKEGRQPGLSLVVASQQPAAIDAEVLTQCGIRVVHRITSREDQKAVDALSQDFLGDGLVARIKRLSGPGDTLVIDDERETLVTTHIRPRQSLHGGGSA